MSWTQAEYGSKKCEFNPAEIRGKARPRFNLKTGRTYKVAADMFAEDEIRRVYLEQCGNSYRDWSGEVHIKVEYQRPYPAYKAKYREGEPDLIKPDIDNVLKLVLDALNKVAWKDDSQITMIQVRKYPRTRRKKNWMRIQVTYYSNTVNEK